MTSEKKETIGETTSTNTLVPVDKYLESGIHIGTRYKKGDMDRFIYKTRQDGLHVLNIQLVDERIRIGAKFLAQYEPEEILVVAGRAYAQKPVKMFAKVTGAKSVAGRFVPGTLTNPNSEQFMEPKVIVVSDPPVDRQAIKEAKTAHTPIVALCDVNNLLKNIDLAIPLNNKGKKSLALAYYLLAREYLKERGVIKKDEDFKHDPSEFESEIKLETEENQDEEF